jgi:hypothetical protein
MDAPNWYRILGAISGIGTLIQIVLLAIKPAWRRTGVFIALIFLAIITVGFFYSAKSNSPTPDQESSPLVLKVDTAAGTSQIDEFLRFLSEGSPKVIIDPPTLEELRRRHITIKTSDLKGVPLQYVLDEILIPQLPGPQQWVYDVIGQTVRIRRRSQ